MPAAESPSASARREKIVLFHLGIFVVVASWLFGGQSPLSRQFILGWGTVGMALFAWATARGVRSAGWRHPALRLLWPLWLYDLLVIISYFNPAFEAVVIEGQRSWMVADPVPWLPSAARPAVALRELWQFNGIVLSAANLLLVTTRRGWLRGLMFVLGGNALLLAVFGTFQKLIGAKGLWFGLVESPQPRFFSTFVYHNHWGAFILLNTVVCLGLLFHYHRRGGYRDFWHSPALSGAVATLFLAASVPLSASRSSTALLTTLLGGAFVHLLWRVLRHRRAEGRSAVPAVTGLVLVALLSVTGIGFLGRDVIAQRARLTSDQLNKFAEEGSLTSRLVLYRDTWRMAMDKPWFGWGLECYGTVFPIYNSQRPVERWFPTPRYEEAHNDWFQSLAETGFVGTTLLILLGVRLLVPAPWRRSESALPRYLLAGCGLVLLYAWLEFPLANPAVMLTFWLLLFAAVRYAALDARAQAEEP